jgi:SRSO17 transposase
VADAVAGLSDSAVYRLMGETEWDEAAVNGQRIETMEAHGTIGDGMLVIDETGIPRKGNKCVGVAPQYCGEVGKVTNCQVVVTTHYVDPYRAWPALGRLYLPKDWCEDPQRREEAQVPEHVVFQTKPEIALVLIDQARAAGIPFDTVGGDSLYGDNPDFVDGLEERGLEYVVGVACDFGMRQRATACEAVEVTTAEGVQLGSQCRADGIVAQQPGEAWQTITWRLGSEGPLSKQFVAVRGWRSYGDGVRTEGWLMGERPLPGRSGDHKYYWSSLPADTPLARLVELAHRRPGIERGYQDGKGETGFRDYAARLWHSFHRYLVIQFLVLSWLVLQLPLPKDPEIALEPRSVESPEEVVFPL